MCFCAFLMMAIDLLHQERSIEIVEPKIFTESACKTSAPYTIMNTLPTRKMHSYAKLQCCSFSKIVN